MALVIIEGKDEKVEMAVDGSAWEILGLIETARERFKLAARAAMRELTAADYEDARRVIEKQKGQIRPI
jgi:hypothetical protein